MNRTVRISLFLFVIVLIVCAIVLFFFGQIANSPTTTQADWIGQEFKIVEGETWHKLGTRLKSTDLIRSIFWYKTLLRWEQLNFFGDNTQKSLILKAGTYTWPDFLTTKEIIEFFQVAQPQKTYPVTIPEGLTLRKVAEILESKDIVAAEEFLIEAVQVDKYANKYFLPLPFNYRELQGFTLEGFLFPDTYFLPRGYSAQKIVESMLQNFLSHLQEIVPNWESFPPDELYQKIILASIVQKEYRATEEAPIIASVFQNRLDQGIKLESCATVVYVLTEELGRPHPNRIFFKDLEVESSYNTYLHRGLPPRPISSVGAIALKATFYQSQTDFLFFVVKDSARGTHTFSSSLDDHNAARESYLNNYFR